MNRDVIIEVRGDLADVNRKIDGLERKFTNTKSAGTKAFDGINKSLAALGSAAVAVGGAAGFGYMIRGSLQATAEIKRLSEMAGVSTKSFQELAHAASRYQITQDALTDGLKELSLRADEFIKTSAGPAREAFERLGFAGRDLQRWLHDTPALLEEITRRMEGLGRAAQIRIADELFGGTGGEQFVQMIRAGAGALRDLRKEAHELGLVMSSSMVEAAKEADTKIAALSNVVQSQFNVAVAELAPDLAGISADLTTWVAKNNELITQDVPAFLSAVAKGAQAVAKGYQAIAARIKIVYALQGNRVDPSTFGLGGVLDRFNKFTSRNVYKTPLPPFYKPGQLPPGASYRAPRPFPEVPTIEPLTIPNTAVDLGAASKKAVESAMTLGPDAQALGSELLQMEAEAALKSSEAMEEQKAALDELVAAEEERFAKALQGQTNLEEALIASEGRISQMRWQRLETEKQADQERLDSAMTVAQGMGAISQLTARLSAQGNETMFEISKAAGYAQAIISVWTGAAKALELPFPANLAAMAQVLATGMGLVTNIQGQEMPSYDRGGISTGPGVYYAGVPEAHIPLQNGKVPVAIEGEGLQRGGASTYHVTINAVDAASFAALVERNPGAVVSVMEKQVRGNHSFRRTLRRYV